MNFVVVLWCVSLVLWRVEAGLPSFDFHHVVWPKWEAKKGQNVQNKIGDASLTVIGRLQPILSIFG